MKNIPKSWDLNEYKDIATKNFWNQVLETRQRASGKEDVDMSDVLDGLQRKARDHARTPMQWDSSDHGGFTKGSPWMRVNDDYAQSWNVREELDDTSSVLNFWKRAISIRKQYEVLTYGNFVLHLPEDTKIFAFTRNLSDQTAVVVLNFSVNPVSLPVGAPSLEGGRLILHNYPVNDDVSFLRGYEGRVYIRPP